MSKKEEKSESTLKEISLTPILTAIFKPSAEYIGKELKGYLKTKIEELKESRRESNIKAHIASVKEKIDKTNDYQTSANTTLKQLEFFNEWVECAQDIDPEETNLSEIWENLLLKASQGDLIHPELLEGIKTLTPKEAKLLSEFKREIPTVPFISGYVSLEKKYLAKSLENKGFLEKDYTFMFIIVPAILFSIYIAYYYFEVIIGRIMPVHYLMPAGVMFVSVFAFTIRSGLSRWRLSWLGVEVLRLSKSA